LLALYEYSVCPSKIYTTGLRNLRIILCIILFELATTLPPTIGT